MENIKKTIGIIAVLAVIVATMAACTPRGGGNSNPESDFQFTIIGNDEGVRITRYVGNREAVVIPARIQRIPVTEIGNSAFDSGETGIRITSVTIPNSVTSIGYDAFFENHLTSIIIPNSVRTVGISAFQRNQLTSITIGADVTLGSGAIGGGFEAAYNNSGRLAGIWTRRDTRDTWWTRHAGIHGDFLFNEYPDGMIITSYRGSSRAVNIPARINGRPVIGIEICCCAFADNQLTSVTIPNSVTSIGCGAFYGNQLTSVSIPNSVISLSGFSNNHLTSVTIPNSVTSIGSGAFADNQLTSITIGADVTLYTGVGVFWAPSFDNGFVEAYNRGGRLAGTYTRPDTTSRVWTRQP